jgi:putative MATE family efflux protein
MSSTRDLTTGSMSAHYRALAIPTAIGMMFTTLYNVVDSFYAGMISTDAMAGLAISFQVFFIMITVGFGLSSAMGALVGNALGEKDKAAAKRIACQGLSYGIIASIIVTILGFFFAPSLLAIISEPGAYRDAANQYIRLLLLAAPGFLLAFGANGILTAQGDTVSMQRAQIAAFFANLVLNPVFIFGIPGVIGGIGFNGIALSTVVSQTGTALWILFRVFRSDVFKQKSAPQYVPRLTDFKDITAQAAPSAFAMMVMMLAGFAVQYFLKDFGAAAVAAYGIGLRVEQLILLPAFGLTGALLPIAAQNFGAKEYDRVRQAVFFCFKVGVAMMLAGSVALWLFGSYAIAFFTDDPEVIKIGKSYLNVDGFLLPVYVLLFGVNSLLQAFKKPIWTLWIGIYRQGFGVFVFSYILTQVFGMGYIGIWFGIAISVVTGFLFSLWVVERVAQRLIGGLFIRQAQDA